MNHDRDDQQCAAQQFQLFVELAETGVVAERSASRQRLDVPPTGAAWISARASSLAIDTQPSAGAIAIEAISVDRVPCLALCAPPGANLRVNGVALGPQVVVGLKDIVELPGGAVFHVSQIRRPYVGKARAQDIGRNCPTCTTTIVEGAHVLVCCGCGTALHDRNPSGKESLECASCHCPVCGAKLARVEETVYVPL